MGQKVNPVGLRLGINRGWDSVWYAKKQDFGNYLIEDFKIREFIKKNVINSGVSKVMIERSAKKCFVTIYTSRPGFVIGKKGSDIDNLIVKEAFCGKQVIMKRFRARAKGRAAEIMKPYSNVTIVLSEQMKQKEEERGTKS